MSRDNWGHVILPDGFRLVAAKVTGWSEIHRYQHEARPGEGEEPQDHWQLNIEMDNGTMKHVVDVDRSRLESVRISLAGTTSPNRPGARVTLHNRKTYVARQIICWGESQKQGSSDQIAFELWTVAGQEIVRGTEEEIDRDLELVRKAVADAG